MSCNTFVPIMDLVREVEALLAARYIDKDDPRITGGVFTNPTIREGFLLDVDARLEFCRLVQECGLDAPFGKMWLARPLSPGGMLISYEESGQPLVKWASIQTTMEQAGILGAAPTSLASRLATAQGNITANISALAKISGDISIMQSKDLQLAQAIDGGLATMQAGIVANNIKVDNTIIAATNQLKTKDDVLQAQISSLGGGKKAYITYQEMLDAAALPVGDPLKLPAKSSVDVINDPDPLKNGLYGYDGVTFTKSPYDPDSRIRNLEGGVFGGSNITLSPVFSMLDEVVTPTGNIGPSYANAYHRTTPIYLDAGTRITFNGYGEKLAAVSKLVPGSAILDVLVAFTGPAEDDDVMKPVDFTTTEAGYYVLGTKKNEGLFKPSIVVNIAPGIDEKLVRLRGDIKNDVQDIRDYISPSMEITDVEAGGIQWADVTAIEFGDYQAKEVTLLAGDRLTYSHKPFGGPSLWSWNESDSAADINRGMPLIATAKPTDTIVNYTYVAPADMTVRVVNGVEGTIAVNGAAPAMTDIGAWGVYQIPFNTDLFPNTKRTKPIKVEAGSVVSVSSVLAGTVNIVRLHDSGAWVSVIGTPLGSPQGSSVSWVADADCTLRLSGTDAAKFLIKNSANTLEDRLAAFTERGANDYAVPRNVELPAKEFVFATAMNYILKTELIGGRDYIMISQDLGKTWTQIENELGDIVAYHFFADGTIMLCSPEKVYWTRDYETLNESTIYDHDGSVFVPTGRHFFGMQTGDAITYVGDTEIYAWGDYVVDATPARIWYSIDRGRTIKCAVKFGTTVLDGEVRNARHTHRVYQRAKDESFYVNTGDDGNENMIMRATYDVATDVWSWKVLAQGIDYKFGNIIIDDYYAYLVTDYTDASQVNKKGIYRVAIPDIGDIDKYQLVYRTEPNEWGAIAPVSVLFDNHGNKVILPDYLGAGFIWVAREGLDFKKVTISPSVLLTYTIGANYRGDIYCVAYANSGELNTPTALKLNRGSYNLTKALRDAGIDNFMRGTPMVHGLTNVF